MDEIQVNYSEREKRTGCYHFLLRRKINVHPFSPLLPIPIPSSPQPARRLGPSKHLINFLKSYHRGQILHQYMNMRRRSSFQLSMYHNRSSFSTPSPYPYPCPSFILSCINNRGRESTHIHTHPPAGGLETTAAADMARGGERIKL